MLVAGWLGIEERMTTEADQHRDNARAAVSTAVEELDRIVVLQCCGHDEYKQQYRQQLRKALFDLIEIRAVLDAKRLDG